MPSKPLNPSIRLQPLIINKKHKVTKNSAKISIFIRFSKYSKSIVSILNLLNIIKVIKKPIMISNLNFGLICTLRSSKKPKIKNKVQNDTYPK